MSHEHYEYVVVNKSNMVVRSYGTNLDKAREFLALWPSGGLTLMKKTTTYEEVPNE